ncbi:uncharacterized protein LOC121397065 [Xenopus laevis]|uniref:Uncharacterized protein LOC121397065 n=1 Tax=Xenopus laevis TaxID=8355 RepID=A0A8J1LH92_XENLA|nr:uncharacterized protein LOC121397065 [Xenopus laevis]XP_041428897.1 uncharacterized protein LOC121397065 [Xenopus laevis]
MGVAYAEATETPENISDEEKTSCECTEGESKTEMRSTQPPKLRKTFIQLFLKSADHERNEDIKGQKQRERRSHVFRFPCLRSAEKQEKLNRARERKNENHSIEQRDCGSNSKVPLLRKIRKYMVKSEGERTSKFIEEITDESQACGKDLQIKTVRKCNIKRESKKEALKGILQKKNENKCEVLKGRMPRDCSENKGLLERDSGIDEQETRSAESTDLRNTFLEQEGQTELDKFKEVKCCLNKMQSDSNEYYSNSNQKRKNSLKMHSEFEDCKIQCTDLKEKDTQMGVREPSTQGEFHFQNNLQENEIPKKEMCDSDQLLIEDKLIFNNSDSKSIKEATCETERLIQSKDKQAQRGTFGLTPQETKDEHSPPYSPKGKEIIQENAFSNEYQSISQSGHLGESKKKTGDLSVLTDNSNFAELETTEPDSIEHCEEKKLDPDPKHYSNKEPNSDISHHKSSQKGAFEDTRWKIMREEVETMVHVMMNEASQKLSCYISETNST